MIVPLFDTVISLVLAFNAGVLFMIAFRRSLLWAANYYNQRRFRPGRLDNEEMAFWNAKQDFLCAVEGLLTLDDDVTPEDLHAAWRVLVAAKRTLVLRSRALTKRDGDDELK